MLIHFYSPSKNSHKRILLFTNNDNPNSSSLSQQVKNLCMMYTYHCLLYGMCAHVATTGNQPRSYCFSTLAATTRIV